MKKAPNGSLIQWILKHGTHDGDECLIWPFHKSRPDGYAGEVLVDGKRIKATRCMCSLVNGPAPSELHRAAHSCGRGHLACIHPKHLRWATDVENEQDKTVHETSPVGIRNAAAKLNDENVREIRKSHEDLFTLARRYGVTESAISYARNGHTWKHVR